MDWARQPPAYMVSPDIARAPARILQRKCACGNHMMGGGKCGECGKKTRLQTKLEISVPGDAFEREADQIADCVLAAPVRPADAGPIPGSSHGAVSEIQRFSTRSTAPSDAIPAEVSDVLNVGGVPLATPVRNDMERRFGQDFADVRVHTHAGASESAASLGAHAYTVGQHVVFGHGRFEPSSSAGRRLLAHELVHALQQRPDRREAGSTGNEERATRSNDHSVQKRHAAFPVTPSAPRVARQPSDDLPQVQAEIAAIRQQLMLPVLPPPMRIQLTARLYELEAMVSSGRLRVPMSQAERRDQAAWQAKRQAQLEQKAVRLAQKQWKRREFWNSIEHYDDDFLELLAQTDDMRRKVKELDLYWDATQKGFYREPRVSEEEREVDDNRAAKLVYNRTLWDLEYNQPEEKSWFDDLIGFVCKYTNPCHDNMEQYHADLQSGMSVDEARARGLFRIGVGLIPSEGPRGPIAMKPGGGMPGGMTFEFPFPETGALQPEGAGGAPFTRTTMPPAVKPGTIVIPEPSPTSKPLPAPKPQIEPSPQTAPKPQAEPAPLPSSKPQPPAAKASPTQTPRPKTTPAPKPASDPAIDVMPVPTVRAPPATERRRERTCPYATGLTPADAIPLRWFKPRHDSFYPAQLEINGPSLERDDQDTSLPDGTGVGVRERYWPRLGKVVRLLPPFRTGAEGQFRALLALAGYAWGDTQQCDHVQDPQWCGPDEMLGGNFWPLETSTNRSAGGTQNNWQQVTFCPSETGRPAVNWPLMDVKQAGYYGRYFTIQEVALVSGREPGLTQRRYPPQATATCHG